MESLLALGFFALGAIVASFMGVLVGRLYTGQGFLSGRSKCDACGKELASRSLVPMLSYVFSRGRAQCCGARLSVAAPIAELILGALYLLAYLFIGFSVALPIALVALALLLALVLYDLAHQILPTELLVLFVVSAGIMRALLSGTLSSFLAPLGLGIAFALFFAALHFFSGGKAMGLSDAPLVLGLSLFAGEFALAGFLFSFWIGAIIGITVLLGRPRGSRMGIEVPFAPFLAAGFLLAFFIQWNPLPLF